MQVVSFKSRKFLIFLLFAFKDALGVDQKIVNGIPAKDGEFPFVGSIFIYNSHTCGATILNNQWALTAASCVYKYVASDYEVRVGSTNWPSGIVHKVVQRVINPGYINSAAENWPNNIALLRVSPPFEFSDLVQPVALAETGFFISDGALGQIAGWGSTSSGGLLMDDLLKAEVPTFSDADCAREISGIAANQTICAGAAGTGICTGDRGGPLLVDELQVGIISWYPATCAEKPAVFTEVSHYFDWIITEINQINI